jgi:hypothetical protein
VNHKINIFFPVQNTTMLGGNTPDAHFLNDAHGVAQGLSAGHYFFVKGKDVFNGTDNLVVGALIIIPAGKTLVGEFQEQVP